MRNDFRPFFYFTRCRAGQIPAPPSMGKGKVASISSAGSATVQRPTTRAGMPATVVPGGTSRRTTLPAVTLEPMPIPMLPRIFSDPQANQSSYFIKLKQRIFGFPCGQLGTVGD